MGALVTFEGVEGAGKSTQVELLTRALAATGREVVAAREPGGTPAGERIRTLLLDGGDLHPRTEALLFAAARAELVEQVIRPALARGAVVVCDRYVDSSLVYQGDGRGLGREPVACVNRWATGGLVPDLVVVLDVDPAAGLARRPGRSDRIEVEALDFHRRVRAAYQDLAAAEPDRYTVIDAAAPVAAIADKVRVAVTALLERS